MLFQKLIVHNVSAAEVYLAHCVQICLPWWWQYPIVVDESDVEAHIKCIPNIAIDELRSM